MSDSTTVLRRGLLGLGVVAGAYGAWLLLSRQDLDQLVSAAIWLASGVVLHDFVLAPLVVVLALVGSRVLPDVARAPAVVGAVVLGTVTVAAIPVLTGLGRRPDNPTLLDRSYGTAWLVLALLVVVGVVVASVVRARAARAGQAARAARPAARPAPDEDV